ncbi:replication initiation protein [Dyadobacter psychrophilus]|uniref:Initiator Replication protein n=1 Tax=Dyadobacter psychrophilus TaxID=651661 RepID=A0A1T5HJN3_9BACT|nr:replication initiation protein [Dyadobacter psychrophilus]SKC20872.1 Initiator Replication protein [Dyadobacter psychrophilus]
MAKAKKKDKREIAQMTLPLIYSEKDVKIYAKQHWNATFARQRKVSVYAKRIMANVLAMIKEDDSELRPYYQMHISSVVSNSDVDTYTKIKAAFVELSQLHWLIEDIKTKYFAVRHLLDTTKTIQSDGFECAYKDGYITIILNPALKPYFIELAHYTIYELKHYMHFSSWYSLRMFELLSAFKDTGIWWVAINEFRLLMDCENKYPETKDLLKKSLSEPLQELESTDLAFSYEPIFDMYAHSRGRKPIIALEFRLKKAKPKNIPKEWFEFSDEHKNVLLRLRAWQVTDPNIIRYAKAIGMERANKLLYEWQLKGKEIQDKAKYCNAVWVRVGKAAIGITANN